MDEGCSSKAAHPECVPPEDLPRPTVIHHAEPNQPRSNPEKLPKHGWVRKVTKP